MSGIRSLKTKEKFNPTIYQRIWYKLKQFTKGQGMPKYQNMYLGKERGRMQVKNGVGVVKLVNAYYDPVLASYIYWVDANGVMVTIPECNLEETTSENNP